jgi:hypothetical protein
MGSKAAAKALKHASPFKLLVTGYTGYDLNLTAPNQSGDEICTRPLLQEVAAVTRVTDVTYVFQVKGGTPPQASAQSVTTPVTPSVSAGGNRLQCHPEASSVFKKEAVRPRYGSKGGPVMEPYREAWKRLKSHPTKWSSPNEWRQAVDDAAVIFATWGELAVEFEWPPEAILGRGGLAWFTAGEVVRSFGPEHAVTVSGRVFDRCPPDA